MAGAAAFLYRAASAVLAPALQLYLCVRANKGKEDSARLNERFGHASRARPGGQLIWIHGASVGETLAALPLIGALLKKNGRHVLLTSGTVSSARLMAERLPTGAFHQYVPLDAPAAVRRFLDHWRPDLAAFIDSELWPNLVLQTRGRKIPLMLVNARMSDRSYRGWRRWPGLARSVLDAFDACLAQDGTIAGRLRELGARNVEIAGSLKADALPLPADEARLRALHSVMDARPVFLAASTHRGEEEEILGAASALLSAYPDLLVIIAPRHPLRGAEIAELARAQNMAFRRRSQGAAPGDAPLYIVDTLGELGLFYRLARFAFLGGSLVRHGGQNPLEPAKLGCAVITGPYTDNFTGLFAAVLAAQGAGRIGSGTELATLVGQWLAEPERVRTTGDRARQAAAALAGATHIAAARAETLLAPRAHA